MSKNFYDFSRLDPKSKLIEWGGAFGVISVVLISLGLLIILNPDYLPISWLQIKGLNYIIGAIPILVAISEIYLIIKTWIAVEKKINKSQ